MIELSAAEGPIENPVEEVAVIDTVGRVVSFRLAPGEAVPETRSAPVLVVAVTDVRLDVGAQTGEAVRIKLQAGQARLFPRGVAGLTNQGAREARFTLIDLPGRG